MRVCSRDEHFEGLRGSPLRCRLMERQQLVREHFQFFNQSVFSKFPAAFPPSVFNEHSHVWARAVLDSRAHWFVVRLPPWVARVLSCHM